MERCLEKSKKKVLTEDRPKAISSKSSTMSLKKKKSNTKGNSDASARFKMITERAQGIRKKHPKMKWKNAIKQASKELFKK